MYWNVIKRVYPIKQYHVTQFIDKLNSVGVNPEEMNGNWREVSKGLNREVFYVVSSAVRRAASGVVAAACLLAALAW